MQFLTSTPIWVWGILGYLVYVGIISMQTRIVPLFVLFIPPAIFISMKYNVFLSVGAFSYLGFIAIGLAIGYAVGQRIKIKIIKHANAIEIPGNYSTIFLFLSLFLCKYIFGALNSINPALAAKYFLIDYAISGIFSGFMLGKAGCFWYKFYKN